MLVVLLLLLLLLLLLVLLPPLPLPLFIAFPANRGCVAAAVISASGFALSCVAAASRLFSSTLWLASRPACPAVGTSSCDWRC
uniref:Putative secreted peptide n=1 Tax=Anopheles braziliensis TaxID=58242 RepID=A0A2M3ZVE0_9DIPT